MWRKPLDSLRALMAAERTLTLVLRLTLFLLLLYASTSPFLDVPLRLICGAMLVFSPLLPSRSLWWALAVILTVGNAFFWYQIDNHKYLITYWTFACAIALSLSDSAAGERYLRATARIIVGLVFFFATFWKIVGGEYGDGSFFYFTFLTDPRVSYEAMAVGGLTSDSLLLIRQAIGFLGASGAVHAQVPIRGSSELHALALVVSWMTLVGEGAVAATHLAAWRRLYVIRHTLLMVFVAVTYFVLPVIGFACALAVLGFAECAENDDAGRLTYLILFGTIHLTLIPWKAVLTAVL